MMSKMRDEMQRIDMKYPPLGKMELFIFISVVLSGTAAIVFQLTFGISMMFGAALGSIWVLGMRINREYQEKINYKYSYFDSEEQIRNLSSLLRKSPPTSEELSKDNLIREYKLSLRGTIKENIYLKEEVDRLKKKGEVPNEEK